MRSSDRKRPHQVAPGTLLQKLAKCFDAPTFEHRAELRIGTDAKGKILTAGLA
jgi:hypothetical protein